MTEQEELAVIDDGRRVERFLADPAVKRALNDAKDRIYDEFKQAKTADERTNAWAKSNALDALADELVRTMSNGKITQMQRDARVEREQRQRAAQKLSNGRK